MRLLSPTRILYPMIYCFREFLCSLSRTLLRISELLHTMLYFSRILSYLDLFGKWKRQFDETVPESCVI